MAGAGYKLFNTGDVLTAAQVNTYLMEQTVMVFANAAARTTALSGVVSEGMISYLKDTNAVEVYDGSNWVSSDDPNAIQNTIVDAKGDLIAASAADTPARLAVGNNGETLVADSSASTGLRWNPTTAAGKNVCINGAFDIWQRGTTFTNPSSAGIYTADRWVVYYNGNGTATRETSVKPDTSTYSYKVTATASSVGNDIYQLVEELNMEHLRGKDVTISVKVAGTVGLTPYIQLAYSTTANDTLLNTGTTITPTVIANPAINASTFVTYISRFSVPTTAKTLRIGLITGSMANTNVVYWAEAQLELGSTATSFSRAGGTLAGELAACQRYFYRMASGTNKMIFLGSYTSSTNYEGIVFLPVSMRTAPTLSAASGTNYYSNRNSDAFNSLSLFYATEQTAALSNDAQVSGTQGQAYMTYTNNASTTVDFSAEL